ncbi:MAG: T6SS immunity protein Tli4 family protein [Janthinobacterium lividum]
MKPIFKKKWVIALAVAVAALTGTWAVGAVQDLYKVGEMTEKMKTVCIGRMLIDLPQETEFNVFLGSVRAFSISADPESAEAFDARMTQREAEIRAKPDWNEGNKNLELVREVKTENGLRGKIFMHGRRVFDGWQLNGDKRERYHFEDLTLEAQLHGNGISVEVSGDEFLPEALENLIKLVTQIVVNPDNRIPTEPGFCLDRVYVREPLAAAYGERVVLMAGLPSHPDIDIKFDTTAGLDPVDKGLLERAAASHARAGPLISARFTNLRAAPRTIGGLTGDELVERVIEENFAIVYGFRWEVIGTEDNVYVPTVELTMKTGSGEHEPVRSSLSEPAAIVLWDKISSSIRIRPTQAPKVSAVESTSPPLGTHASAGDTCPQTGWWQCGDGGNGTKVRGGERQYIRQGERMPQALLLPQPTLWDRLRGVQPSYEAQDQTAWRLVDKRSRRRLTPTEPLAQAASATLAAASTAAAGIGALEQAPVGAYAITGSPCPASGWWHCQESGALDETRWFAQGNLLPAATFAVPGRVSGKTSRTMSLIQRRETWQLMRLAAAPEANAGMPAGDALG